MVLDSTYVTNALELTQGIQIIAMSVKKN